MLRPQPVNRVANAMPGAALAALGFATLLHGAGLGKAGGVGFPLGILLAFRGYRMGAETRSGSVIIVDRLTELITTLTTPDQASQWLAGATAARSHLLQERGLNVAVERLSTLMTSGDPLARSTSATD